MEVKLPEADGAPTQTDCELCDVIMADVFDTIKDDRSLVRHFRLLCSLYNEDVMSTCLLSPLLCSFEYV